MKFVRAELVSEFILVVWGGSSGISCLGLSLLGNSGFMGCVLSWDGLLGPGVCGLSFCYSI